MAIGLPYANVVVAVVIVVVCAVVTVVAKCLAAKWHLQ